MHHKNGHNLKQSQIQPNQSKICPPTRPTQHQIHQQNAQPPQTHQLVWKWEQIRGSLTNKASKKSALLQAQPNTNVTNDKPTRHQHHNRHGNGNQASNRHMPTESPPGNFLVIKRRKKSALLRAQPITNDTNNKSSRHQHHNSHGNGNQEANRHNHTNSPL